MEGRSRFVQAVVIRCKITVKTSSASLTINNSIFMTTHAITQDIKVHYNVVWYKVVQSGTLHSIQLRCVDPDIIYNICQWKIQLHWVNTSAGTTFCHKTSLLPEFCKAGHVLTSHGNEKSNEQVIFLRSDKNNFFL